MQTKSKSRRGDVNNCIRKNCFVCDHDRQVTKSNKFLSIHSEVAKIASYLASILKGKCYGSEPVAISLQLTHFQSLIGLRMNHIIFR